MVHLNFRFHPQFGVFLSQVFVFHPHLDIFLPPSLWISSPVWCFPPPQVFGFHPHFGVFLPQVFIFYPRFSVFLPQGFGFHPQFSIDLPSGSDFAQSWKLDMNNKLCMGGAHTRVSFRVESTAPFCSPLWPTSLAHVLRLLRIQLEVLWPTKAESFSIKITKAERFFLFWGKTLFLPLRSLEGIIPCFAH